MRCSLKAITTCVVLGALLVRMAAAESPRPPQPPLTNATLDELRDARYRVRNLQDNAFLYEIAAQELSTQVESWAGADALLNLTVDHVTKEAVHCRVSNALGVIAVVNEQPSPDVKRRDSSDYLMPLAIGDVISLDVARRLRAGNVLVVRGKVDQIVSDGRTLNLIVSRSQAAALVSREFTDDQGRTWNMGNEPDLRTPHYPAEAIVAKSSGTIEVLATNRKIEVISGTGSQRLDDAVKQALATTSAGARFPGKHRVAFELLTHLPRQ
jgi:hypothetical protein